MIKLLLNPFERFAGLSSLIIGVVGLLLTALLAFFGRIHLDGVLDLHIGAYVPFYTCLAESLVNWLSMAALLYLAGLIFSRSSIRFIDVLGTQAMARLPMLLACLVSWALYNESIEKYFAFIALHEGNAVTLSITDWLAFGFSSLVMLVCIVWMVSLMYKAYSISCNMKGTKAIISFIICMLIAEIGSKLILNLLY